MVAGTRAGNLNKLLNFEDLKFDDTCVVVAERSPYSTQLEIDTFLNFWLLIPFIPASSSTPEK